MKTRNCGRRSTTSSSPACTNFCCPGWWTAIGPAFLCRSYTTELALFTSIIREQHTEEYIEIRARGDGRLVTLVDVVSPANKTTAAGRDAYLAVRHVAEQGESRLPSRSTSSRRARRPWTSPATGCRPYDHCVTVTRVRRPDRYEIYTATVQKRLPKFKLPLAADDRDAVLDLQVSFVGPSTRATSAASSTTS